jgi:hypothetical protein
MPPGAPQQTWPHAVGMPGVIVAKSATMPATGLVVAMIQRTPAPPSATLDGTTRRSPR